MNLLLIVEKKGYKLEKIFNKDIYFDKIWKLVMVREKTVN